MYVLCVLVLCFCLHEDVKDSAFKCADSSLSLSAFQHSTPHTPCSQFTVALHSFRPTATVLEAEIAGVNSLLILQPCIFCCAVHSRPALLPADCYSPRGRNCRREVLWLACWRGSALRSDPEEHQRCDAAEAICTCGCDREGAQEEADAGER